MISIKNYFFLKKVKKANTRSFYNQNRTIILSFKKAVVYILFIKKYNIRKWCQTEFKKGL